MCLSKRSSCCPSAAAVGYNDDLMGYIFFKLPVKSVLKCKCVCKQWQSIASNPQFCHQHASLRGPNPTPDGLLFQRNFENSSDLEFCSLTGNSRNSTTRIASFDYLNPPANGKFSLLSSCNGLLLFQSSNSPHFREFYVCNPTTKKFIRLALPKKMTACPGLDATLAFDPCVSPHYKVVFLWLNLNDRLHIAIYSSEMKSCGKVMATEYGKYDWLQGSGVFCNGKIYWVVKSGKTSLSFDVEQGFLKEFQLPVSSYHVCDTKRNRCFGASRGRLYLLQSNAYTHYNDKASEYVYKFNEGCSGWVLTSKIGFKIDNLVLSYVCEEQDEGSTLLQLGGRRSNQIVAYNLKEKTTKKVCDLNPLCNNRNIYPTVNRLSGNIEWCSGAYQLIESLACV